MRERERGSAPLEFLLLGVPLVLLALVSLQLTLIAYQKARLADFAVTLVHEIALADRGVQDAEVAAARILAKLGGGISPSFETTSIESATGRLLEIRAEAQSAPLLIAMRPLVLRVSAQAKTELD